MEISVEKVLSVIKRNAALILILALIAAVGAYFASAFLLKPSYSATIMLSIIGDANLDDTADASAPKATAKPSERLAASNNNWVYANKILKSCQELLETSKFKNVVKAKAGIDHNVAYKIVTTEDTNNMRITVTDITAEGAYNVAVAIGTCAIEYLPTYYTNVEVKVADDPVMPINASNSNYMRNALLAAIIVAAVVIAVKVLSEAWGSIIRDEKELSMRYGIPVIAVIPDFNIEVKRNAYDYYARTSGEEE